MPQPIFRTEGLHPSPAAHLAGHQSPPSDAFPLFDNGPAGTAKTTLQLSLMFGERDGIRTHDPLIKSQMLYQLSYALLEGSSE